MKPCFLFDALSILAVNAAYPFCEYLLLIEKSVYHDLRFID